MACCVAFKVNHIERNKGFEQDSGGSWHINGCCGGGCYVLMDINYCPFCGEGLPTEILPLEGVGVSNVQR